MLTGRHLSPYHIIPILGSIGSVRAGFRAARTVLGSHTRGRLGSPSCSSRQGWWWHGAREHRVGVAWPWGLLGVPKQLAFHVQVQVIAATAPQHPVVAVLVSGPAATTHAVAEPVPVQLIVWSFCKLQGHDGIHEALERAGQAVTQRPRTPPQLFFVQVHPIRVVLGGPQLHATLPQGGTLPWQRTFDEVHQHVRHANEIITPCVLHAQVALQRRVPRRAHQLLVLAVRQVSTAHVIDLGHAKIHEPNAMVRAPCCVLCHQHIFRLHVAVQDAGFMQRLQPLQQLVGNQHHRVHAQALGVVELAQRFQVGSQQLHDPAPPGQTPPGGRETLPHDASGDSHGTPDTDVTSPSPIVLPPATYRFVGTFLITLANFRLMQREYAPELSLTPLFEAQLEEEKATEGKCVTIESIQSEIVKNVVDECLWKSGNTLHESSYVSFRSRFLQYVTFHPIWQARFIKDITNEIKSLQPIKDIVPEDLWTFTIHPHCQKLQVLLDLLPEILKKPSATPRFHALKVLVETSVKRFARLQATISKSQEDRQDSQDQQDAPDLEGPEDQESSEDLEGPEESSFQDHEPTAGEVCAQRKHEETENDALEDVLGVDTEILALRERFMELHDQLLQQIQRQSRVQFCVACLTNSPAAELKKLYLKLIQKGAETWSTPNLQEECHKREKIVFLQFAEAWDAVHQPKDTVGEETKDHLDVDGAAAATAAAPGLVSCQQYQGTDGAEEEEDLETRWNAWLQRANAQVCEVLLCDAKRQAVFTVLKKRKETSEVQTTAGSAGSAGSDGETEASEDEDEASADKSSTTGKSESSRQEECIIC